VWVFLGWVFLGGCTQKNPLGFFGYVPGCLNPAIDRYQAPLPALNISLLR